MAKKKKNTGAGVPASNTLYTSFGYEKKSLEGREDCLIVRYAADPKVLDSRPCDSNIKFHAPVLFQFADRSDSRRFLSCRCTASVQRVFEESVYLSEIENKIFARFNVLLDWKKR